MWVNNRVAWAEFTDTKLNGQFPEIEDNWDLWDDLFESLSTWKVITQPKEIWEDEEVKEAVESIFN